MPQFLPLGGEKNQNSSLKMLFTVNVKYYLFCRHTQHKNIHKQDAELKLPHVHIMNISKHSFTVYSSCTQ